ncbi:MAG: hypothetical protein J6M47_07655 [Clostridia bacterium]|nr:hypothetical protein [Clostridia bacterium]
MKKGIIAALCFIVIGCSMVSGTFALPDLDKVFADLTGMLGHALGLPEAGGAEVDVALVTDTASGQLYPGGTATRSVYVKNQGAREVCYRLAYAVQYDAQSWDKLTLRFAADEGYIEHDWQEISISGVPYRMKVFTYDSALPAGQSSGGVSLTITMDRNITSEQIARYRSDFLQMQVLAIDPVPFREKGYTTAQAALDIALPLATLNPF